MATTPEQQAYFKRNTTKPKNVKTWMTFTINHPDWSEPVYLVGLINGQGVEFDLSRYTFEGVNYRPVSMQVDLPSESKDSNGNMTIWFPRAGTEVKRRMKEITPTNARTPISFLFRQYQEGVTLPVKTFSGNVSTGYPRISGNDVSVQADVYNPSLLTSANIIDLELFPELRES